MLVVAVFAETPGPPTFSSPPSVSVPSATQVQVTAAVDEDARCMWVVVPHGDTAPSPADVADVQRSGGAEPIAVAIVDMPAGTAVLATMETGTQCAVACDAYVVCEDEEVWPERQAVATLVEFSTDTSPPQFSGATPSIDAASVTDTSVDVLVQLDEPGTVYAVAVLDGSAAPSLEDVLALAGGDGAPAAAAKAKAVAAATQARLRLEGLLSEGIYHVYVAASDAANPANTIGALVYLQDVQTADSNAPRMEGGFPGIAALTATSFDVEVRLDELGVVYCVVQLDALPVPSVVSVISATGSVVDDGSAVVTSTSATFSMTMDTGSSCHGGCDVWCVAEDNEVPPNIMSAPVLLDVATDVVPPAFVSTFPAVAGTTATSIALQVQLDQAGTAYAIALIAGAAEPTAEQVRDQVDAAGDAAVAATSAVVFGTGETATIQLTGLMSEAVYDVYVIADDAVDPANLMASHVKISGVQTLDGVAPSFMDAFPAVSSASSTGFDIDVALDEAGTAYCVVLENNAAEPTPSEVVGALGSPMASGSVLVASVSVPFQLSLNGVSCDVGCDVWCVAEDDEVPPNVMSAPVLLNVATDTIPPTFLSTFPTVAGTTATSIALDVQLDQAGAAYAIALIAGASEPTAEQTRDLMNAPGDVAAAAGGVVVAGAGVTATVQLVGLMSQTSYDVYVIAEDAVDPANLMTTPIKIASVLTLDGVAPSFMDAFPAVSSASSTSFDIDVALDEPGTAYCVVLENDAAEPTPSEVVGALGSPMASGSVVVASVSVPFQLSLNGVSCDEGCDVWCVAEDDEVPTNVMSAPVLLDVATDVMPPAFVSTFPVVAWTTATSIVIDVQLDTTGTAYAVALIAGAAEPTAEQTRDQVDAAGDAAVAAGSVVASEAGVTVTIELDGLISEATYDVYVIAEDAVDPPNLMASHVKIGGMQTEDANAPSFTQGSPSVAEVSIGLISVDIALDEPGIAYCIAVANPNARPSSFEVRHASVANVGSGSTAVSGVGAGSVMLVTGSNCDEGCSVWCTAIDSAAPPNLMAAPQGVVAATQDTSAPTFTDGYPFVGIAIGGASEVTVRIKLNEPASVTVVAVAAGSQPPTELEFAALEVSGISAASFVASTIADVRRNAVPVTLSGLPVGEELDLWLRATDTSGNTMPYTSTETLRVATCPSQCAACSGVSLTCILCPPGFFTEACTACDALTCELNEFEIPCQAGGDISVDHSCGACDPACASCSGPTAAQCSTCATTHYDATPDALDGFHTCLPCTTPVCPAGMYVVACQAGGADPSADQYCANCDEACNTCTAAGPENCQELEEGRRDCSLGFTNVGGTCQVCSACAPGQFVSVPCTADADSACSSCDTTVCSSPGTFEVGCRAGGDAFVDHSCEVCDAACLSSVAFPACADATADTCFECAAGYFDAGIEEDGDRECRLCDAAVCGSGTYELECQANGDATVDHACLPCDSACLASVEFPACGDATAETCAACAPGFYDAETEDDEDRECVPCSTATCTAGQYSVECQAGGDQSVNHSCEECSTACLATTPAPACMDGSPDSCVDCASGYYDAATQLDLDRECVACDISPCGAGTYEVECQAGGDQTTDHSCPACDDACLSTEPFPACGDGTAASCVSCAPGYYDTGSEIDGDRECAACSTATCGPGKYSVACQEGGDQTVNHSCPSCDESCVTCTGPAASDCSDLGGGQLDCAAGYFSSGGACVQCSAPCGVGEFESVACSSSADRVCSSCHVACSSAAAYPACGDATAAACVECAAGYYDDKSVEDADRECVACATPSCSASEYATPCREGGDQTVNAGCAACSSACNTCDGPTSTDCADVGGGQRDCADGFYDNGGDCVACSAPCGDGQYEPVPCTPSTNRVCSDCNAACSPSTAFPACGDGSSLSCVDCADGYFDDESETDSDRECVPCSTETCSIGEVDVPCQSAGDQTRDHECSGCHASCLLCLGLLDTDCLDILGVLQCAWGFYDAGSACTLCSVCGAGEYEAVACSSLTNRDCQACDDACLATNAAPACWDGSPDSCVDCAPGYYDAATQLDLNRECVACDTSPCGAGTYEVACQEGGDQNTDHSCPACDDACLSTEPFPACGDGTAASCVSCAPGFYDTGSEIDGDRECAACSTATCGPGKYSVACQEGGDQRVDHSCPSCDESCVTCTGPTASDCSDLGGGQLDCAAGYFASGVACVACSAPCGAGEFESVVCSPSADRVCSSCHAACSSTASYPACGDATAASCVECAAGYYDSESVDDEDRECVACTTPTCAAGEYTTPCQDGGDQAVNAGCAACSAVCNTCDGPTSADCADVGGGQRDCADGYYDDGGDCVACSAPCGAGQFESVSCTPSTDRVCSGCDAACSSLAAFPACGDGSPLSCVDCADGHFDDESEADSDRECVPCDTSSCGLGTYDLPCRHGGDQSVNHECRACDPACDSCTGPSATECKSGLLGVRDCASNYFSSGGECVECTECGVGQLEVLPCTAVTDTVCSSCSIVDPLCAACADGSSCSGCLAGSFLDTIGDCLPCSVPLCGTNEFSIPCSGDTDATCAPCDAACVGCTGPSASQCIMCAPAHYLDGGECKPCAAGCSACSGPGASGCLSALAPLVESAEFAASGAHLDITFNLPVVVGRLPAPTAAATSCYHLLQNADALLGSSATCSWISSTVLRVGLSPDATILPTSSGASACDALQTLVPMAGAFMLVPGSLYSTTACIPLTVPEAAVPPTPVLVGPAVIGSCGGISLDAGGSFGGHRRSLLFSWSVQLVSAQGSLPHAVLSAIEAANAAGSSTVQISPAELAHAPPFVVEFTVSVASFLFWDSPSLSSVRVQRIAALLPELVVLGSSPRRLMRSNPLALEAVAIPRTCSFHSEAPSLAFNWTLVEPDAGSAAQTGAAAIAVAAASARDRRLLRLPAGTLVAGVAYRIRASVTQRLGDDATVATADVVVEVSSSTPVALISGQSSSGRQLGAGPLRLDATTSYDPDGEVTSSSLIYSWSCSLLALQVLTVSTGCQISLEDYIEDGDTSAGILSIPSAALSHLIPAQIQISVRVAKPSDPGAFSSPAVVTVSIPTVVPDVDISLEVVGGSSRVAVGPPLRLRAAVSASTLPTLTWAINEDAVFRAGSSLFDDVVLSPLSGPSVVVDTNLLVPGSTYTFSLSAIQPVTASSATASITIELNAPPRSGHLQALPTLATAVVEPVEMTAIGWDDDESDLPLTYQFTYTVGPVALVSVPLSAGFRQTRTQTAVLPGPVAGSWDVRIGVSVRDALGAVASSTARADGSDAVVRVVPIAEAELDSVISQAVELGDEAVSLGDAESALAAVSAISSVIDPTPCGLPACSGHGACDDNSGLCVCSAGWVGTRCSTCVGSACDSESMLLPCPGDPTCSGHGSCQRTPSLCGLLQAGCIALCFCDTGYFGLDCSVEEADWGAVVSLRDDLVDLAVRAAETVDFEDQVAALSVMGVLAEVTSQVNEITLTALTAASGVLQRAAAALPLTDAALSLDIDFPLSGAALVEALTPVVGTSSNLLLSVAQSLATADREGITQDSIEALLDSAAVANEALDAVSRRLTVGQESGEFPNIIRTDRVTIAAARFERASGSSLVAEPLPDSPGASVMLPRTLGEELPDIVADSAVDVRLVIMAGAVHVVSAQLGTSLRSSVARVSIAAASTGDDVVVEDLGREPILLHLADSGGVDAAEPSCSYVDEISGNWSSAGVTLMSMTASSPSNAGVVVCGTTHLTEFSITSAIRSVDYNTVSPFRDAGELARILDADNRFVLIAAGAVVACGVVAWVLAQAFQLATADTIEQTKETLFIEYGMIHKRVVAMEKNDILTAERAVAMERRWGPRRTECHLFFVHLLLNLRTRHPWIAAMLPPRSHALVFPRTQQLACLVSNVISAFVATAVFFGKQPRNAGTQILTGVIAAACMIPSTIVFPSLFTAASSIVSAVPNPPLYRADDEPSRGGAGRTRLRYDMVVQKISGAESRGAFAVKRVHKRHRASVVAASEAEERVTNVLAEIVSRAAAKAPMDDASDDETRDAVEADQSKGSDGDTVTVAIGGASSGKTGDAKSTASPAWPNLLRIETDSDADEDYESSPGRPRSNVHLQNSFSWMFGSFRDDPDVLIAGRSSFGSKKSGLFRRAALGLGRVPSMRSSSRGSNGSRHTRGFVSVGNPSPKTRGSGKVSPAARVVGDDDIDALIEELDSAKKMFAEEAKPGLPKSATGTALRAPASVKRSEEATSEAHDKRGEDSDGEGNEVRGAAAVDSPKSSIAVDGPEHNVVSPTRLSQAARRVKQQAVIAGELRRLADVAKELQNLYDGVAKAEERKFAAVLESRVAAAVTAKAVAKRARERNRRMTLSDTTVVKKVRSLMNTLGWHEDEEDDGTSTGEESMAIRVVGLGVLLGGATSLLCGFFAVVSSLYAFHVGLSLMGVGVVLLVLGHRATQRLKELKISGVMCRAMFAVLGMAFEVLTIGAIAMAVTDNSPLQRDVLIPAWRSVWVSEWEAAMEEAGGNATVAYRGALSETNEPAAALLQMQREGACCGFDTVSDHPLEPCDAGVDVGCQALVTGDMVERIMLYSKVIFGVHLAVVVLLLLAGRLVALGDWLLARVCSRKTQVQRVTKQRVVSRTGDEDLDAAVNLFQAVATIQHKFRLKRTARARQRRVELRRFRRLEAERRVLVTATYAGLLVYTSVLTYVMLIFGVKFTSAMAQDWLATSLVAVGIDVLVQGPAAVVGSTIFERYIIRSVMQTRLFRAVSVCMATIKSLVT